MNDDNFLWDGKPQEYWIEALSNPNDDVRWSAIDALRHIARPSTTIALFIPALKDRYWMVRALAAHSLYDMAYDEEAIPLLREAVMPLAEALSDESCEVAVNAAFALEFLGIEASVALPQLADAARNGDEQLRKAASDAIRMIDL